MAAIVQIASMVGLRVDWQEWDGALASGRGRTGWGPLTTCRARVIYS